MCLQRLEKDPSVNILIAVSGAHVLARAQRKTDADTQENKCDCARTFFQAHTYMQARAHKAPFILCAPTPFIGFSNVILSNGSLAAILYASLQECAHRHYATSVNNMLLPVDETLTTLLHASLHERLRQHSSHPDIHMYSLSRNAPGNKIHAVCTGLERVTQTYSLSCDTPNNSMDLVRINIQDRRTYALTLRICP